MGISTKSSELTLDAALKDIQTLSFLIFIPHLTCELESCRDSRNIANNENRMEIAP
jgi:hypothetical protein